MASRSIYRRAARMAAAETSQTPEAAQRHLLQVLEARGVTNNQNVFFLAMYSFSIYFYISIFKHRFGIIRSDT